MGTRAYFTGVTILISLPTGTKIFNWLSTYLGNPPLLQLRTSSALFALLFLLMFTIGIGVHKNFTTGMVYLLHFIILIYLMMLKYTFPAQFSGALIIISQNSSKSIVPDPSSSNSSMIPSNSSLERGCNSSEINPLNVSIVMNPSPFLS